MISYDTPDWDEELDAIGLICPLPVLKARKRLLTMAPGQVLRLLASDPAAVIDVPHYCNEAGHSYLGMKDLGAHQTYLIRRG
ncbi:sulfurtransferase TusA family protein [Celeribacter persicus]|jgi:Predicted redox protein, regulator of disulfide bond formation|uniref:tRNA 2-thiouridine synthesizing protein A n=1 Tax=Celeribacter persicus TaxID=1651082 RepID=A0A2T5HWY8_9RHOB|nr:sulfurtransferase TusA family protein [Celeribacter persicus]PTQ75978.1 tRNA 2-thiouridine synthesizing protein A [Celeribacter persicus]